MVSTPAIASSIAIIVPANSSIDHISTTDAANLFLGLADPGQLTPLDRDEIELRKQFYQAVSGLSLASIRAHWAKQVFTGRARPPRQVNLDDLMNKMDEQPFAISYIWGGQVPAYWKVILSLEFPD